MATAHRVDVKSAIEAAKRSVLGGSPTEASLAVVALADEAERLRAALAPFAKVASDYDDREDDHLRLMVDADQIHLTVGDVRAARAALKTS